MSFQEVMQIELTDNCIEKLADAVKGREKGHWVHLDGQVYCSNCTQLALLNLYMNYVESEYCPTCGAYMLGEEE